MCVPLVDNWMSHPPFGLHDNNCEKHSAWHVPEIYGPPLYILACNINEERAFGSKGHRD